MTAAASYFTPPLVPVVLFALSRRRSMLLPPAGLADLKSHIVGTNGCLYSLLTVAERDVSLIESKG